MSPQVMGLYQIYPFCLKLSKSLLLCNSKGTYWKIISIRRSNLDHHYTEKVLIKIFNDVCCALDDGRNAVLVLLDLSWAFDKLIKRFF